MSLISVNKLTFCYDGGFEDIFKDVSFAIDTDWKLGFVGRNGRGKTTFLRLLMNEMEFKGSITSSVKFEYFPFAVRDTQKTTLEIVEELLPEFELWELLRELNLLEMDENCLYRSFESLSGGEKTKALLAALFLKENSFLLIDEPTNHLDFGARELVSRYLSRKKGFILVSHDRAFLDGCVDHILSIKRADIEVQKGNFSSWLLNKEGQDSFERAQNERLKSEIERLKAAAKSKANWSDRAEQEKRNRTGEKDLRNKDTGFLGRKAAKIMKASKVIERRQDKAIEEKSGLLKNIETVVDLKLIPLRHKAEVLVETRDLSLFYGDRCVISGIDFAIGREDRIAVLGRNGSGKTTLLKLLLGEDINYSGRLNIANGLKVSFVPQDTTHLRGDLRSFALNKGIDETLFKSILNKLDFGRSLHERDICELSAGQKKKILIAASLSESAHLYIWDEPLNYIDMISRMQLEEVIKTYRPTMLFVEHDKAFLDEIATSKIILS